MKHFTKWIPMLAVLGSVAVLRADVPAVSVGVDAVVTAPTQVPANLSSDEMRIRAASMASQMQDDLHHILLLKEQAKKQKDVIKLNCVNDKLIQVKAQLNIAESTDQDLQAALAKNSDDRQSIFTQLVATSDAIRGQNEAANSCAGGPELYKQESGVVVQKPELQDNPTVGNPYQSVYGAIEPPAYASPFN
jgi:hypothetical protein